MPTAPAFPHDVSTDAASWIQPASAGPKYGVSADGQARILVPTARAIEMSALSGLLSGIAANADLYVLRNNARLTFGLSLLQVRWETDTAFPVAQAVAVRAHHIDRFAVHDGEDPDPDALIDAYPGGGLESVAHYVNPNVLGEREEIPDLVCQIAESSALTDGGYLPAVPYDPFLVAVGAGSTIPGIYEDWTPANGTEQEIPQGHGLLVRLQRALTGGGGAGHLWINVQGRWIGA